MVDPATFEPLAVALGLPADPRDLEPAGRERLDALAADARAGLSAAHEELRDVRARLHAAGRRLPDDHPLLLERLDALAAITRYRALRDALDAYRDAATPGGLPRLDAPAETAVSMRDSRPPRGRQPRRIPVESGAPHQVGQRRANGLPRDPRRNELHE